MYDVAYIQQSLSFPKQPSGNDEKAISALDCHPARSRRVHKDLDSATPLRFAQNDMRGVDSATPLRSAQNDRIRNAGSIKTCGFCDAASLRAE